MKQESRDFSRGRFNREVIERYSVDGIHLDYIRYGHMVYCFCPAHIEKAAKLGINVDKVRGVMFETL